MKDTRSRPAQSSLTALLAEHFPLDPRRLTVLSALILAVIQARSVVLSLGVKSGEEVGKRVCKPTVGLGEHGAKGIQATSEEAFGRVAVSKAA